MYVYITQSGAHRYFSLKLTYFFNQSLYIRREPGSKWWRTKIKIINNSVTPRLGRLFIYAELRYVSLFRQTDATRYAAHICVWKRAPDVLSQVFVGISVITIVLRYLYSILRRTALVFLGGRIVYATGSMLTYICICVILTRVKQFCVVNVNKGFCW